MNLIGLDDLDIMHKVFLANQKSGVDNECFSDASKNIAQIYNLRIIGQVSDNRYLKYLV